MGTRTVSVLSLLALSLNATVAMASEPASQPFGNRDMESSVDLSQAYRPDAVYVTSIAASVTDESVNGSFTIENTEDTLVTGLQYRLELRGTGELDGLPYGIDVVRASLALAPGETKKLLFATPLPNVPAGRYDLRVQLLTAKGRALGWMDTPVIVTPAMGADTFATLVPGTIGIAAYGDEVLPPLSGPNVDPSSSLTLRATAVNGDRALRVTPVVDIYDFNAARVALGTFAYDPITLAPGENATIDLPLTAESTPGTYMAHVTLKDDAGTTVSSIAQYRFVVKGDDADIIAVRIANMGTAAGDWAYGTVDIAGSADALTTTVVTLRVAIRDDNGTVGSIEVPGIELTDSILSANIRIPLDRNLIGSPIVDASVISSSDTTLDHVSYAGTLTPAQLAILTRDNGLSNWIAWHGISRIALFAFLAVAAGFAVFTLASRMRGSIAFARAATAAFLLVCMTANIGSAFAAGSGGIETLTPKYGSTVFAPLGNRPIIALFVNSPVHGQQNNFCNRQIQLDYRLEYGVCENEVAMARVVGRVTRDGGLLSAYDVPGTQWQTVHNRTFQSQFCSDHYCFQTENVNETIDLSNVVDPNANTATLQLLAKWGRNIAMPDASFDRNDTFIQLGWAHALNVHLQCTPPQLSVTKVAESAAAVPGGNVTYTFSVTNNGQTNAPNVTLNDVFLQSGSPYMPFEYVGANGAQCSFNAGSVQTSCSVGSLTPSQTKTFTVTFRVPQNQPQLCGQTVRNRVEARSNGQSTGSASAEAQVNVTCPPSYGCIEVFKEGFTADNQRITGQLPSFSFKLDGQITASSDQAGFARFNNVQPGTHTVTELSTAGWTNFLVTPPNGQVQVQAGANCAGITFKNRQDAQDADLQIQKTGPTTVVRGQNAVYTLVAKNNGPASSPNTIVGDPLPAGTTFVASQSDSRCQLQGTSVFCTLGTLAVNQQTSLTITLNVQNQTPSTCQPGTILNRASILGDRQDRAPQNNESTFTTQATCPQSQLGCIEILKEGFTAENQRITGQLPSFTFKLDGNQTVQSDAQGRATFQNVTPGQHTVTELATTGWTNFLVTPANGIVNVEAGTSCAGLTFKNRQNAQTADLRIIKTGPSTVVRFQNITYSIAVKNLGPATATNVIVGDPIPAGTTFVSSNPSDLCHLQGTNVFCTLGTLAPGSENIFELKFNVSPQTQCVPGTIVNRASVLADQQDTSLANNESTVTTQVTCPVAEFGCIDIFKEGFDNAGSRLSQVPPFKFILDGNSNVFVHTNTAGNARLSNVPVGQHTVTEVTASGWTLFNTTPTGGVVNVTAGNACAGVVFKNRQSPQNADVSILKSGPATAVRGGNITYSIVVTNNGPAVAQNVVVDDQLPSGLTNPVVNGNGCTVNNGAIHCTIGSMNMNEQRVITVNATIPAATGTCTTGTVTNTGSVGSSNDVSTGNNTSSITTQLQCPNPQQADLQIQKTGSTSVVRGQNASYTLVVKNNGPSASPNTIVGDPLPAGTTFVASQSDSRCQQQGTSVFCNLGTLAINQQVSLAVVLNVTAQTTCQTGSVVNNASVLGDLQDPTMSNNQSAFTTQVTCPMPSGKDVSIVKSGPSIMTRGDTFTYTLAVTNNGPATATGVIVSDTLPSNLTFVSASAECLNNAGTVTCQAGTLTAGQTRTFTISMNAPNVAQCSQVSVTNTATVSASGGDNNAANNTSSLTTQINCQNAQYGCIDVLKEVYDANNSYITPVPQFTFTLDGTRTAVNDAVGRARFDNVPVGAHTVTESLPSGWTQQSVTPQNGTVNVLAGTCVTVNFKNRQSTTSRNWTITKTDHESEVEPGDSLTYEIRVTNNSSTRQTNVTIIDTLPDEVDFTDASPNETYENGRNIRWENQTFEAYETRTYEVDVDVDDNADGTLTNRAEVEGVTATDRTDVDDNGHNNNDDVEIDLTKTASTSEVLPGGIIDYTVRVRNTGNDPIENLTLVDNLPADVIVIDDGHADHHAGRRLEWDIDEIDDGDEFTVRYRVSVPTYAVSGQIIRNDVCVDSDDEDLNECESVTVYVLGIIPKTGAHVRPANEHLTPITRNETPSDTPFFGLIALLGAATGAGIGFARRMFLGF